MASTTGSSVDERRRRTLTKRASCHHPHIRLELSTHGRIYRILQLHSIIYACANDEWWWRAEAGAEAAADALRARHRAEKGTEPISPAEIFDDGLRTRLEFEPEDDFVRRMGAFRSWLVARPERRILVVAHWGVWYSLLDQKDMANCELVRCAEDALVEGDRLKAPPP